MVKEKPADDIERIFLTFNETQKFLGVSHQTIYKLMQEGLPSHKIGKKRVFLKEDLIRWIKEHEVVRPVASEITSCTFLLVAG